MSDLQPVFEIKGVYKSYDRIVIRGGYTTLKTQLIQLFNRRKHQETIEKRHLKVLKNINFSLRPGETLAVIGQNGAGKSTLLRLLTGIFKPTEGTIVRRGRISALLELGAGFHPEFSGRENIYMNGMILGLSKKEIKVKEQEIIDFAELEEFIDAPVRTYSSGMYMRLAFSIAVSVDPEILVIDEILAVGDEHFQHKSKARLDQQKDKSSAIVLVTHDLNVAETWCSRCIWLHQGQIAADGDPKSVTRQYRNFVAESERIQALAEAKTAPPAPVLVHQA